MIKQSKQAQLPSQYRLSVILSGACSGLLAMEVFEKPLSLGWRVIVSLILAFLVAAATYRLAQKTSLKEKK